MLNSTWIRNVRVIAIVLLGAFLLAAASTPQAIVYDGPILDRPTTYDSNPTHMFLDGMHYMWWCSKSNTSSFDAIFLSTRTGSLTSPGWSSPIEVFDQTGSPWATRLVCDPTVIYGDFSIVGMGYKYAMYYTADDGTPGVGVNNAIGAAFSNNGTNWVSTATATILPDNPFNGTYGAGMATAAWIPDSDVIALLYNDTTIDNNFPGRIRYKESIDGVTFSPTPSMPTLLNEAGLQGNDGREPSIAYSPLDDLWYAAIRGWQAGLIRVIRLLRAPNLFGPWEVVGDVTGALTGLGDHQNPALARNDSSSLYIDSRGWAYVFYGEGEGPMTIFEWTVSQARFRIFETSLEVVSDSFRNLGGIRRSGNPLDDTAVEVGGKSWTADPEFVVQDGAVTTSSTVGTSIAAMTSIAVTGEPEVKVSARLDLGQGDWNALGFSSTVSTGLFGGELWILLHRLSGMVTVYADSTNNVLTQIPVTDLEVGYNTVALTYRSASNSVTAAINGVTILDSFDLGTLNGGAGFTPNIQAAGFSLRNPEPGGSRVDDFRVNGPDEIFKDGFETGDFSRWSETG